MSALAEQKQPTPTKGIDLLERLPMYMKMQILRYFGFKDYSLTSRACKYLQNLWKKSLENKKVPLFVPEDCKTIQEALSLISPTYVQIGEHDVVPIGTQVRARWLYDDKYYSAEVVTNVNHPVTCVSVKFKDPSTCSYGPPAIKNNVPLTELQILKLQSKMSENIAKNIDTIVIGKVKHTVTRTTNEKFNYLDINVPINIFGKHGLNKKDIIIDGGIRVNQFIKGNVHLENMTISHKERAGLRCLSAFTIKDIIFSHCKMFGFWACGPSAIGIATNVEVHHSGNSGVCASHGGIITVMGENTSIHDNVQKGGIDEFGLAVSFSTDENSSIIDLVHPLKLKKVAVNNKGGGDIGAYIANIEDIKEVMSCQDYHQ